MTTIQGGPSGPSTTGAGASAADATTGPSATGAGTSASDATTAPSALGGGTPPNTLEIGVVRAALEVDYEVLEELGRGGMAVVYRARERALDRDVAIKVLPAVLAFDEAFVERFQREARTAGQLEHPNIVPIYRVGRSGHVIFFVMKLLRGQSLSAILQQRHKLPAADVRHILLETTSALGYAAKRGVVHRDIKPDNILLDSEGRCVITDFGIAKTASGPRTAAGTSMGTPRYMSPEHGQGAPVDGRSDIYSLGVVAYECLCGALPFDGEDPFAVLYKHINAPVPRPELTTQEEWGIYAVIERMLAKRPDDRFQSSDDLIAALGGRSATTTLVSGRVGLPPSATTPTEIIPTGPVTQLRRFGARRWPVLVAGAVALLVGGYLVRGRTSRGPISSSASSQVSKSPATADSIKPSAVNPAGQTVPPSSNPSIATTQTGAGAKGPRGGAAPVAAAANAPVKEAFSRCPKPGSTRALKAGDMRLMVDSVTPRREGQKLTLSYDVCGLNKASAYNMEVSVERLNQHFLKRAFGGRVDPVKASFPGTVDGPRTRRKKTVDISHLPPGSYAVRVAITDANARRRDWSQEFEIRERRSSR